MPSVKLIGYWGDASESDLEAIESMGVPVFSFADLIQVGAKNPKGPQKSSPDDTCTLMYTSGTTGTPKGVVIKQSNIMSQMSSVRIGLKQTGNDVHPDDVFISYLPLAHIFDRIIEVRSRETRHTAPIPTPSCHQIPIIHSLTLLSFPSPRSTCSLRAPPSDTGKGT